MDVINVGLRIDTAAGFAQRLVGWLCRSEAPRDAALFFPRCNAIHTFFMRFAIDVVFVDRGGRVLRVIPDLPPWRFAVCASASGALELAAGVSRRANLRPGLHLQGLSFLETSF